MRLFVIMLATLLSVSTEIYAAAPTSEQLDNFLAATGMTSISQNDKNTLMQNLTAEDLNNYLDFLKTETGKSYLAFNKKTALLFTQSMKKVMGRQVGASTPSTLSAEQSKNYQYMMSQSATFQTLKYMQGNGQDDGIVARIMMASVLKSSPDQLGDIYRDYAGNMDSFDSFNKSQTAHDVMVATAKVAEQEVKDRIATH